MNKGLFDDIGNGGKTEKNAEPKTPSGSSPLAERMRPRTFNNFVGQSHVVGEKKPLRRLIEEDTFGSLLLWGPPGSGKTTLAEIATGVSGRRMFKLSAVESGVKELKEVIKAARYNADSGKKNVLFIDEIHRYSKVQQDALLPHVESGLVTLIGATTENPSFGVIPALRSRCQVVELTPLSFDEIKEIVKSALADTENGLGGHEIIISDSAVEQIVHLAAGDARVGLSLLESCVSAVKGATKGTKGKEITEKLVSEISQKASLLYDKLGQQHYDHASAFQKSMRGSDADAAVYWMGRMIEAGEDPRFIARRLIVCAAEDVGNADPTALILAVAAADAVEKIGMPEGRIPLAQAVIYVACAPKSNASYKAIGAVLDHLQKSGTAPTVPNHLRDTSYKDAKKMGHGKGYKYPHDYPDHFVAQSYLPDEIKDVKFYEAGNEGREAAFAKRLKDIKGKGK